MSLNRTTTGRSFTSLQLSPRHLFLPATLVAVYLLRVKLHMPFWGLLAFLLVLPIYYIALPAYLRRKEREFERGLLRLLQRGRKDELLEYYRRQRALRLLGSSDRLQRRLGFIYFELGDFDRARACYARAAKTAPPAERVTVLLGLANARYRAGDYEGAEVVFRELLRRGQKIPEVLAGLAHTLLLLEKDPEEALRLARRADQIAPSGTEGALVKLTLAEALLESGKIGKARRVMREVEIPPGDVWLEARRSWVLAALALTEGRRKEAREHLEDLWRLDETGGLGDRARRLLAELEESSDGEGTAKKRKKTRRTSSVDRQAAS